MNDITVNKKTYLAQNWYDSDEYKRENHPWNIGWEQSNIKTVEPEPIIVEEVSNQSSWIDFTKKIFNGLRTRK